MDFPNEEKDIERCLGSTFYLGFSFDELETENPFFLFSPPYSPSSTGLNFIPKRVAKITKAVEINIIMMPRADS